MERLIHRLEGYQSDVQGTDWESAGQSLYRNLRLQIGGASRIAVRVIRTNEERMIPSRFETFSSLAKKK